ncbi:protein kinase [Myxococcaceae bacterium GXIMD 01537]
MSGGHETEIWLAIDEGVLSRDEADALLEEARRLDRGPLELLRERGRLSDETLASLLKERRASTPELLAPPDETAHPGLATPTPAATGEHPAFPLPGWDRYQPVRFLGQGGMGRVFLALDPRLRRQVALKFVRDDEPEHTRRFISEARAQAKVNHERVCKVYEVGHVEGRVFIAMQYIDGQPLSALVRELTVEQKALVLRDAALGVHEAHRAGLIHRDLKPSNILVERAEDGTPRPYVMDFGLARDWSESVTATGTVLGTPHYMSPEQARGEVARLDRRADVYSLGASLYFLLTGQAPIPGGNGLEVLNNIPTVEPRPPRALDPDLPVDLEAITLKCLEKERGARYDSARALAEDLDRFLAGEPVRAHAGLGYRVRKRLRKHRMLATVAGTALLAVSGAAGWGALARHDASERERLARRFTERVEHIESQARYSALSRLHDTRDDLEDLRAQMDELETEIQRGGERALGPGHYALGRGHLALGDDARAREHLESAWRHGFREPRAAYALALVTGRLYQRQLLEAQRLRAPEQREARLRDAEQRYRDPALDWLRQSRGAPVPSLEYVEALVAFYEGRLDDALVRLDAIGGRLSWFHEAPTLRGDILGARAYKRWNAGDAEGARADFEAGRSAYAAATATAESDPGISLALARLEADAMAVELYGQGDVMPAYQRALAALSRCLVAAPEHYDCWVWTARLHLRLAEARLNQGDELEALTARASEAAQRAQALIPARPEAPFALARGLRLRARRLLDRGEDPRELLGKSLALLESVRSEDRDHDYHVDAGLLFKTWADAEDKAGVDAAAHRDRAIAAYESAISLDPRVPEDWMNLGAALLTRAGRPKHPDPERELERAGAAFEKARALNPQHVVPYFYAGQVHDRLARRLRERGADPRPELSSALSSYQQGLTVNPKLPHLHNGIGVALLLQAEDAWERGETPWPLLEKASASFAQAITVAPAQGFAYLNLGSLHAREARYLLKRGDDPRLSVRAAEMALGQALERMPGSTGPRSLLGTVYVTSADFELGRGRDPEPLLARATEELRRVMEKGSKDAEDWLQLGRAQAVRARWRARLGRARPEDFEEAARSFEKAVELSPDEAEYRLAFGLFCRAWAGWAKQAGQEPSPVLQRGRVLVEQVLKARPGWPEARALRAGLVLAEATDAEVRREVREALTQALASNPYLSHEWKDAAAP